MLTLPPETFGIAVGQEDIDELPIGKKEKRRLKRRAKAKRMIRFLLERDHHCLVCGESRIGFLSIDHIVPKVSGGTNHRENLALLCRTCNSNKSDSHPMEWFRKLCNPLEAEKLFMLIKRAIHFNKIEAPALVLASSRPPKQNCLHSKLV